jgi:hypothetical protein
METREQKRQQYGAMPQGVQIRTNQERYSFNAVTAVGGGAAVTATKASGVRVARKVL